MSEPSTENRLMSFTTRFLFVVGFGLLGLLLGLFMTGGIEALFVPGSGEVESVVISLLCMAIGGFYGAIKT
jgi:hypothetical protein